MCGILFGLGDVALALPQLLIGHPSHSASKQHMQDLSPPERQRFVPLVAVPWRLTLTTHNEGAAAASMMRRLTTLSLRRETLVCMVASEDCGIDTVAECEVLRQEVDITLHMSLRTDAAMHARPRNTYELHNAFDWTVDSRPLGPAESCM